jgi:hypothetical protein
MTEEKGHTFWRKWAEEFKEMHVCYVEIWSTFAKRAKIDSLRGASQDEVQRVTRKIRK